MKNFRKILILTLLFFTGFFVSAKDASFTGEDYDIKLCYNDTAFPGQAIFVRMKITQNQKKSSKSRTEKNLQKAELNQTTAKLNLFIDDKLVDNSNFYVLPESSSKNSISFLTGIPLSSWWTENSKYYLLVKFNYLGLKEYEFKLPFELLHKDFINETIPLNDSNTNIKTDTSPKRMEQIKKLNEILETINPNEIYQTKAFVPPTTATRRTSFFADRRLYAYSNGKSSTSLHYGIDYGIPTGSEVLTCANGKVVLAENRISTGWSVVVEHLPGLYSLYYHMDSLNVKKDDFVKEGQILGLSGSTGLATGPHLHWEMRLNMSAVDPDFFTNDFTFENQLN